MILEAARLMGSGSTRWPEGLVAVAGESPFGERAR
jgi:hypothetical protein